MSRIEDEVCKKIAQRAEVGKSKYGVTMETSPISRLEWLIHAQEEAMDLAVYLQKLIEMEREQLKFHSYSIESAESVYSDGTKRREWTHEDRQELIRLYEEGISRNEIAKIMCRPISTVNVFCTRYKQTGKLEGSEIQCTVPLNSGPRKGQPCGRNVEHGTHTCQQHKNWRVKE